MTVRFRKDSIGRPDMFNRKKDIKNITKLTRKQLSKSLFTKSLRRRCFWCEFCEIIKNNFFIGPLQQWPLVVAVMRLLVLLQDKTCFEAVQTDLSTSRHRRCEVLLMNLREAFFRTKFQYAFFTLFTLKKELHLLFSVF